MKKILLKLLLIGGTLFPPKEGSSQNLLTDGNFSTTTSITPFYTDPPPLFQWASFGDTSVSFKTSIQNGIVSYLIDNPGFFLWEIQLDQFGFSLQSNHRYRLSFDVKADADRDFGVFLGEHGGSWTNLNPTYTRHATADWQTITIDVNSIFVFPMYQLSFEMGGQKTNMYFANISLIDLGPLPVRIAGTFESELGCSSDWMPDCDNTALTYNSKTGLWSGTFNIPAGCQQYKVTINGTWDVNFGENGIQGGANIYLYVPSEASITFTYDPNTHLVTTSPIASGFSTSCLPQVVLTGSLQDELGCSSDWDAGCSNTALKYSAATGQFENDFNLPSGYYEYRIILNNDWGGGNFGIDGIPNAGNYNIYLPCAAKVHFAYDPVSHVVKATYDVNPQPNTVVVAGSFQSEVGCSGDWQPDCDNTRLHYNAAAQLWIGDTLLIPAGHWEYKFTINNSWDENYGQGGIRNGDNIMLDLCSPAKVVFTYSHLDCYNYHFGYPQVIPVQPNTAVIAGSFQSEVGCTGDWQPDCNNTRMHYDPLYQGWLTDTLHIPAGHWEYKVTVNNSWDENYGLNGERNGANIPLDLCTPAKVFFNYYHYECNDYVFAQIFPDQPNTVVIAGTFQSELGCSGDWVPDCNNTRMKFNANIGAWVDTLLIPAGHWEYRFALNNSMDVSYGSYGQLNDPPITLDLCYSAKVAFIFATYSNCNGYGSAQIITNGVCLNKFYDPNLNGYPDPGEEPMGGVKFTLTGKGISQTQTTGSDGKASFTNLPDGIYVIKENVPSGYYSSVADSQSVYLFGNGVTVNFGNVCIGPSNAKGIGFWTSKNGQAALVKAGKLDDALIQLRYNFSLRNADGTDFDPFTYAQLKTWLMGANAKNMTYMLSAQLAAMFLNTEVGYVDYYNSYVYTPGCSWWGNFMSIYNLISYTNYYLWNQTTVDGKNPERGYLECLKNAFDNANNNLTFVQPHPCTGTITKVDNNAGDELNPAPGMAKIWPNPSNNYFTLRPAINGKSEEIQIRVYNSNGQQVYLTKGSSSRVYQFGERFTPGVYLVELVQGDTRSTLKLVKQ